jgi:predicted enzyme related to lactoylglutathione lyase
MANPVVWFEVMGQDADKLRNFYNQLLGWKFNLDNPMNYGVVETDEEQLGGGIGQVQDGPGWSTFYTRVGDLEAAVSLAEKLGSTIRIPITDLPDMRIAVVTDPEGHAVGLCDDAKSA